MGVPKENEEIAEVVPESNDLENKPVSLVYRFFNWWLVGVVFWPSMVVLNIRITKEPIDLGIMLKWPFLLIAALYCMTCFYYVKGTLLLSPKNLDRLANVPFIPIELTFKYVLKPLFKALTPIYLRYLHTYVSALTSLSLGLLQISVWLVLIGIVVGIAVAIFGAVAALPTSVLLAVIVFLLLSGRR